MIVSCPECNKRYQVESSLIPDQGRPVRCASCGHVWLQQSDVVEQISQNPRVQGLKNVTANAKATKQSSIMKPLLGWGSFGVTVIALLGFILLNQSHLTAYFPQSKKIYSLLGISYPTLGEGLAITDAKIIETSEGHFVVKGNLVNISDQVRELTPLQVKALGPDDTCKHPDENNNCVIKHWQLTLDHQSLLPGEQVPFESSPYPFIKGAESVGVSF